ncbi:hypothetical protein TWF132_010007 [Orbilia oligospora]|nr:hypothetical protein TWF128_001793 [Orbilia oligospora]KAF3283554.1 hypothetical protein TWF132_010007 [Orbilia oligospora]
MAGTPYGKNIYENDCTMAEHRLKMGENIEIPATLDVEGTTDTKQGSQPNGSDSAMTRLRITGGQDSGPCCETDSAMAGRRLTRRQSSVVIVTPIYKLTDREPRCETDSAMAGHRLTWWQLSVDGRQPYGLTAQWPITGSPTESNPAVLTAQWPDSDLREDGILSQER